MKRVKLNVEDFIELLTKLQEEGVNDIILFAYEDQYPAITDAEDPQTCIIFANDGDTVPGEEEGLH
jgi:peroxiredoxin